MILTEPFDKKYKTVIRIEPRQDYMDVVEWLNKNSAGAVNIRFIEGRGMTLLVGFENNDDALVFKIKFSA